MCVRILAAPGSVPARQPEGLEAQAQVCDTRRAPGRRRVLGAGNSTTVWEEHPPAAHRSQLRLFSIKDPGQRFREERREFVRQLKELFQSMHRNGQGVTSHTKQFL